MLLDTSGSDLFLNASQHFPDVFEGEQFFLGETDIEAEEPELIIEGLVPMQDSNESETRP